ncbi:MAG: helix-turn-helix domain-containing protein [Notoacmeibacter sp.]|nr:helix-turn-helix domain-containing protein [Notoacmeibacter sp.]
MIPNDMSKASVGARLRILRHALDGSNASAFCRRVGWKPNQLSNYESGSQYPRMDQLDKLHRNTLVGLDYVLRGDLSSTPEGLAIKIRHWAEQLSELDRDAG